MADAILDVTDRLGERERLFGRALEDVVGQPFGGLGPDAGESSRTPR